MCFFKVLGPKASQKSLKRPKKAPKRHPKKSKTPKKRDPKLIKKLTNFGPILGSKKVSKTLLKRLKKQQQNCYPMGHPSPTSQGSK